ncbi:hypothetical protein [Collimonas sp. OK412]|jgi:hypothetical protein|uniref:hypothetical protein n=1 Tax=Collimonas sp. (strain OK412) TaxID=1801619 RepID=UPI0008EEF93D|nr:hypothetical protein [Collimonas sp. OK412]SFC49344.1 hypothetical protein SAMN04515619_108132 [Collimonas sp. OK412]
MKFSKSIVCLFLLLIFFPIFILTSLSDFYSNKYRYSIVPFPKITQHIQTGELISGFRLEQPVNWNAEKNLSKLPEFGTLCINLLLANYMDRENTGIISLSLRTESFSRKIFLNVKAVRNNSNQQFCYSNISLNDVIYKPAALLLEGVDSPPNKAITAWMTSDTAQGEARRQGIILEKSLIFSIDAIIKSNQKRMHSIILTILCFLSILILFLPIKSNDP